MPSAKSYENAQRIDTLYEQCGPNLADVVVPDVTTTGNKPLGVLTIPGDTVSGGERYDIFAMGTFTTGGTAPTAENFTVYADGVGSGTIALLSVPNADLTASLTGAGWTLEGTVIWVDGNTAECSLRLWWHKASGGGGTSVYFTVQSLGNIDTSQDRDLTLAFGFTGSAMTLKTQAVHIARRG